jgi:carbamoyltransferase
LDRQGEHLAANILGISAFFHDSAAALVQDGHILAAAQEERFTRRKGDSRFPSNAISYCLSEGSLAPSDIDCVTFYEKPLVKLERLLKTYLTYVPSGFESFRQAFPLWATSRLGLAQTVRQSLGGGFAGDVLFADHHESHAASAFFPSPFERAAILTLDAVGEWATSSIGIGEGNRLRLVQETSFPHSVGLLYSAFTYYLGFRVNSGEYKVMGLAPYGEPRYADVILGKLAHVREDGSLFLDQHYFEYSHGTTMTSPRFHELFGAPPRQPEAQITQQHMDLAASIQKVCEEVVLRAARHAHQLTGARNLVMAGGVALNCVANARILNEAPFDNLWIQPAAGDAGGSLGAALLAWHHHKGSVRQPRAADSQQGSFLGPSFDPEDIQCYLESVGAEFEKVADEAALMDRVAHLLASEHVVGWFQGRMEFGPRALGARSVLADARSPKMQQTLNLKVKYRESFRPFAPSVLRECVGDVFEVPSHLDSPYMLLVAPVAKPHRTTLSRDDLERLRDPDLRVRVKVVRSDVPAVTHVDYSARIQTVDAERHGRYYLLLRRFKEITGCPVLVNTSFNVRGEPIVCSPADAFRCFMASEMDYLVMEDFVIPKESQRKLSGVESMAYRGQYALD